MKKYIYLKEGDVIQEGDEQEAKNGWCKCKPNTYGIAFEDGWNGIRRPIPYEGKVAFLYNYKGEDIGGGPRCWCGAELMNAMVAGLAGVCDHGVLFRDVTLSPRFVAADEPRAHVRLEYAASGAALEYHFGHDPERKQLTFDLLSRHERARLRMLLPEGASAAEATVNGAVVASGIETVGTSRYLTLAALPEGARVEVRYGYASGV